MKHWTIIFRALANINRLKIIKLLVKEESLNVSDIADKINISIKATSKHLIILNNLNILESDGKHGHVFYKLNPNLPSDIRKIVKLFIQ